MKKLVLSLAVLFSVAMVSCGGNKAAENADSDSILAAEAIEEVVAVDSNDTTVAVEAAAVSGDSATVVEAVAQN